ncbi:hypothetical protein CRM22_006111 [Opisthorchis felineus]|uniref:CUB domain-containing protein n=1 Tax=Opisthorchis felineus TaxID=147828 RepID=A0A4S2LMP6_OPIFE|nr:hypothetical protein CRM22_006111 [Opisthorchis felineus]
MDSCILYLTSSSDEGVSGDTVAAEYSEVLKQQYGGVTWETGSIVHHNCVWRITNPFGKPVLLQFNEFKVGVEADVCESNYVSVFDVNGGTETEFGKWCGGQGEGLWLLSTGSSLSIRLHTDGSIDDDYFDAKYVSTNCQFDLSNNCAYFTSPPAGFESVRSLKCLWKIRVPDDFRMRLLFQEFNVDGSERDCQTNALQLFSGTSAACSGVFENESGSVTWTSGSGEKRNCEWQIRNPSGKPVLLHFKTFKVGDGSGKCHTNYVSVIDVNGNTENELGRWCGTEGEGAWQMSTGSSLLVRLRTVDSVEGDNFEATYVSTNCQFDLTETGRYLNFPTGEHLPNHPLRCLWRIRVPKEFQMRFQFQEFNVGESDENCETNGLHIFGEVSGELAHINAFCGSKTPWETTFEQKHLTLFLNTNAGNTHKMFKSTYAPENFQRTISLPTGNIDFGGKNKLFVKDARWILKPIDGKRVMLSFHSISLGGLTSDCERNYVKVYDGETAEANLLGTYCGTIKPIPVVSSGPRMFIHLHRTDAFKNDRFMAHHTSFPQQKAPVFDEPSSNIYKRQIDSA